MMNPKCAAEYPSYSTEERDRRFELADRLMEAHGLDGLVVFGSGSRQGLEEYFSNEPFGGIVVIPRKGEPRLLTLFAGRIVARREPRRAASTVWIPDALMGITPDSLADTLREKGLSKARLGAINGPEGQPFTLWQGYTEAAPDVEWVNVTKEFHRAGHVKSEEQLEAFRWCSWVGEKATEALIDRMKPGVHDSDLVAAFLNTVFRYRATVVEPVIMIAVGPECPHYSTPTWWACGGKAYALQSGDVVQAEAMVCYAGLEMQAQFTVALSPAPDVYMELAPLARTAYETAVDALRAGAYFGDVMDVTEKPMEDSDGWTAGNAIHILNPDLAYSRYEINVERSPWLGPLYRDRPYRHPTEEMRNLLIEPYMTFTIEPSPGKGNSRIHTGGNVIIREEGPAEELNSIGTDLVIV